MPHLIGVLGDRNANVFFGGLNIVEQAKLNRSRRFRKEGKVYAVAQPGRAQRIGITEPSLYRSHKRAAHLCGMERALAITNSGAFEAESDAHGAPVVALAITVQSHGAHAVVTAQLVRMDLRFAFSARPSKLRM